jgi:hypothetical protein
MSDNIREEIGCAHPLGGCGVSTLEQPTNNNAGEKTRKARRLAKSGAARG